MASALVASGCLWGVVKGPQGVGVSAVTVTYTDANGNTSSTTSGAGGLYVFDSATGPVPSIGTVTFDISKQGYQLSRSPTWLGQTSALVLYNDNPGATLENMSSFWEVQIFGLDLAAGNIVTVASGLSFPAGAVYRDIDLFFSERGSCVVKEMTWSGEISVVAGTGICGYSGDGGPAISAQLNAPTGLALDQHRNLVIVDTGNCRIRKVDLSSNTITTVAGNGTCGFAGDGGAATLASLGLSDTHVPSPYVWSGVDFDRSGNMYIADGFNCRVRKVDTVGKITTFAGSGPTGFACGSFGGDGGPAAAARLDGPSSVAVAPRGDVFVADLGNCRIRMVDAESGIIRTVAGNGDCTSSGDGGAAKSAGIANPRGLAIDAAANLYISELRFAGASLTPTDCRVRRVDNQTGKITTVAGSGTCGYGGDEGPATAAQINTPAEIAVGCFGEIAFAEPASGRIRIMSDVISGGPARGDCPVP